MAKHSKGLYKILFVRPGERRIESAVSKIFTVGDSVELSTIKKFTKDEALVYTKIPATGVTTGSINKYKVIITDFRGNTHLEAVTL